MTTKIEKISKLLGKNNGKINKKDLHGTPKC